MTKRMITGTSAVLVLILLMVFVLIYTQKQAEEEIPSPPSAMGDAVLLISPDEYHHTHRYDLAVLKKTAQNELYTPLSKETLALSFQNGITPLITRTLTLSDNALCQYGLFEKNHKSFAVFYADVTNNAEAERLCHRILSYRDYFPCLLFGSIPSEQADFITSVCRMSANTSGNVTFLTSSLSAQAHLPSGTLTLSFQTPPRSLDLSKKMIALTYDDGPSATHTKTILSVLEQHQAKATFFVNGTHVTEYPDVIRNTFAIGCEIGNHTNLHELFSHNTQAIIRKTIEDTNQKIRELLKIGTIVVRPPGGELLDRYQKPVSVGYPLILWSIDTLDYTNGQTPSSILRTIQNQAKDGDIILMHDTGAKTAEATKSIVSHLTSQGFQLVTVSELLEFSMGGAVNDRVYPNQDQ